jgi:hypothetical protein
MVIKEGIVASAATWVEIPYVTELQFPGGSFIVGVHPESLVLQRGITGPSASMSRWWGL